MSRGLANDKILLDRFLQGEEAAFIEIYDHYWYRLFLSAYRRIRDKADAEELVQNLFLKLWEKRMTLQIDHLENYLFSAIRNSTIDFLAKQMVADRYVEYQKVYTTRECRNTEEVVQYRDLEESLEKGLRALSGKSEKVFRLSRLNHWPVEKIAGHLQLSEKTVHYHLTKSTKFIRHYLLQSTPLFCLLLF